MERNEGAGTPISVEPHEVDQLPKKEPDPTATAPPSIEVPDDGFKYHQIKVGSLPSLGMPYPGVPAIPMREWTTQNAENILGSDDAELRDSLTQELQKATPFPIGDLTYGDAVYLLLWQRVNTFGQFFETNLYLSGEKNPRPVSVDLTKIENDTLNEAYLNRKAIKVGGKEVQLDLAREKNSTQQAEFLAMHPKAIEKAVLYALTIQTIDGKKLSVPERARFVHDLSARDFKKLEAWHEYFYHHPKEELVVKHPETSEVLRIPYRFLTVEFIVPDGGSLFDIGSEICGNE